MFSGVGKTDAEMAQALELSIHCFNVESASELDRLDAVARRLRARAPVSFRVNPDVDPRTHPYISTGLKENKFGVAFDAAHELYRRAAAMRNVEVRGIDMHIGSQITELGPHLEAAEKAFALVDRLAAEGIRLQHIDVGGGIGIRYRDEETIDPYEYALAIGRLRGNRSLEVLLEPGRFLVGNAGVLLTRVLHLKPGAEKNFAIVDAAMNDLLRPALYDAWHDVRAVQPRRGRRSGLADRRAGLRERRFPRARPRAGARRRRPSGDRVRRCLRDGDELQLQLAAARRRGHRRRRQRASGAIPRAHRRSVRERIVASVTRFAHEKMRVQIRNTDVQRHIKQHLNLVFRKKMARIQAAGVNGFVNGFMHKVVKPDG